VEKARFNYYDGRNPGWPVRALSADLQDVLENHRACVEDAREVETIITENEEPENAICTKALVQTMLGAPSTIYNGGLLQARVRYFDAVRQRPGLPKDVGALVETLTADTIVLTLANISWETSADVVVQAGGFGEHQFKEVCYDAGNNGVRRVPLDSRYVTVHLPPSTSIRLELKQQRCVNRPSYSFPWHNGHIPVPFQ